MVARPGMTKEEEEMTCGASTMIAQQLLRMSSVAASLQELDTEHQTQRRAAVILMSACCEAIVDLHRGQKRDLIEVSLDILRQQALDNHDEQA